MQKYLRNLKTMLVFVLIAVAGTVWYSAFYFESYRNVTVTFFDVGQGDSILVDYNGTTQLLIDGGPDDSVLAKLGREMPFWDRTLEAVILTHPDKDHIAGLVDVIDRYGVGVVVWTGVLHSSAEYQEWVRLLADKAIPSAIVYAGYELRIGDEIVFEILAPFEDFKGKSAGKINDTSIIGRLRHGKNSILLMGDASTSVERRLLFESPRALNADILKVGHHGSKTSTSEKFLDVVTPDIAVISVGKKNRYGHPYQGVLDNLAFVGADIFRSDHDGDIQFKSDGNTLRKMSY